VRGIGYAYLAPRIEGELVAVRQKMDVLGEGGPRMNDPGEILLLHIKDGHTRIDVRLVSETVWLSAGQIADLFQRDSAGFDFVRCGRGRTSVLAGGRRPRSRVRRLPCVAK